MPFKEKKILNITKIHCHIYTQILFFHYLHHHYHYKKTTKQNCLWLPKNVSFIFPGILLIKDISELRISL